MKKVHTIIALVLAGIFGMGDPGFVQINRAAHLIEQEQQSPAPRNLAILIFDGVQIIDYTGPFETFGHVYNGDNPAFNMYTVSAKTNPITTAMGMSVNPKYSIENAPAPDVLVIPGGGVNGTLENAAVIKWVQEKAKNAEVVLSVCNGAFILAKAGLLDGLEATTTANLIPSFRQAAPRTRVVEDRRFVDNGKIITAAGLSSGIDGALHVIERLFGRGTAQMAALGMEYNWDPDSKFARAALADKYMRFNYDVKVLKDGWKPISREGNRDQWENRWAVTTESSANEVLENVNNTIAGNKTYSESSVKWTRVDSDASKKPLQSLWRFTDEKGGSWSGSARVEPVSGERNRYTLSVKVARNDVSASVSTR